MYEKELSKIKVNYRKQGLLDYNKIIKLKYFENKPSNYSVAVVMCRNRKDENVGINMSQKILKPGFRLSQSPTLITTKFGNKNQSPHHHKSPEITSIHKPNSPSIIEKLSSLVHPSPNTYRYETYKPAKTIIYHFEKHVSPRNNHLIIENSNSNSSKKGGGATHLHSISNFTKQSFKYSTESFNEKYKESNSKSHIRTCKNSIALPLNSLSTSNSNVFYTPLFKNFPLNFQQCTQIYSKNRESKIDSRNENSDLTNCVSLKQSKAKIYHSPLMIQKIFNKNSRWMTKMGSIDNTKEDECNVDSSCERNSKLIPHTLVISNVTKVNSIVTSLNLNNKRNEAGLKSTNSINFSKPPIATNIHLTRKRLEFRDSLLRTSNLSGQECDSISHLKEQKQLIGNTKKNGKENYLPRNSKKKILRIQSANFEKDINCNHLKTKQKKSKKISSNKGDVCHE